MSVFCRALVVVSASFFWLALSLPARADMLYLVCKFRQVTGQLKPVDAKLEIDLTNGTVNDGIAVYPATISATSIYYKIEFNNVSPRQLHEFTIDRVKGTLTWSSEIPGAKFIGDCTSSNTASPTKF
jgi:hypothetical protein